LPLWTGIGKSGGLPFIVIGLAFHKVSINAQNNREQGATTVRIFGTAIPGQVGDLPEERFAVALRRDAQLTNWWWEIRRIGHEGKATNFHRKRA
jgi:hypothetical protein